MVSYDQGSRERNWEGRRGRARNQPGVGETTGDILPEESLRYKDSNSISLAVLNKICIIFFFPLDAQPGS